MTDKSAIDEEARQKMFVAEYTKALEQQIIQKDRELADCRAELERTKESLACAQENFHVTNQAYCKLDEKLSRLASHAELEGALVKAYCAANDYINALLNSDVPKESLEKIAADYWQKVREVK